MNDYKNLINKINEISLSIQKSNKSDTNTIELIDTDVIDSFKRNADELEKNINENVNENRLLRVGIIGAVKAGKSSFLNALIFDGKDILPKAATPMTAALTRITYSDTPNVKVVFYNTTDWNGIKSRSKDYCKNIEDKVAERIKHLNQEKSVVQKLSNKMSEKNDIDIRTQIKNDVIYELSGTENAGCDELVVMAEANSLNVNDFLNSEKTIDFDSLNDYVGSDGKYTPLVKWIEISLDSHELEGLEIIDTPGLNDPIQSRSMQTLEFLSKCDVVFLLSYSGQFMTSEDIQLLNKNLPDDGIRNAFLVGSKFDSAICDSLKMADRMSFNQIAKQTVYKLSVHARNVLSDSARNSGTISETIEKMKSEEPFFISSILYNISEKRKNNITLSKEENHILNNLSKFRGFDIRNHEFLRDISCIDEIKNEALKKVKYDKDKIISERISHLFDDNKIKFLRTMENIDINAHNNRQRLETADIDKIEVKLNFYKNALNSIRTKVKNCFELHLVKAKKSVKDMQLEIESMAVDEGNYSDVQVKDYTDKVTHTTGHLWWKKTHYTTVTTKHASVNDVIKNLRAYAIDAKKAISEELNFLFETKQVSNELKQIIVSAFDTSNPNFDENDIINPVEILLESLTILPEFSLDVEEYINMIVSEFSLSERTDVEGNEIGLLVKKQNQVLAKMSKGFCTDLDKFRKDVELKILNDAGSFVDRIEDKIKDDKERLENQLSDRKSHLARYDKFISQIKEFKQSLYDLKE